MPGIRIIIADDDIGFASELSDLLSSRPKMVVDSLVTSLDEVFERLDHRPADVVILDIDLTGLHGPDTVARVVRDYPRTKVLLLSAHDDLEALTECADTGATCLPKDLEPAEMLRAVAALAGGASLVTAELVAHPSPGQVGRDPDSSERSAAELSAREAEVLRLVSEGLTVDEIGASLSISPAIVHNHVSNIRRKLQAADTEAVLEKARARGLLPK